MLQAPLMQIHRRQPCLTYRLGWATIPLVQPLHLALNATCIWTRLLRPCKTTHTYLLVTVTKLTQPEIAQLAFLQGLFFPKTTNIA